MQTGFISSAAWLVSIALHGLVAWLLVDTPLQPTLRSQVSQITFSVTPRAYPTDPKISATAARPEQTAPTTKRIPITKRAHAAVTEPVRQALPPADLTGTTLTGEQGAVWSSEVGGESAVVNPLRGPPVEAPESEATLASSAPSTRTHPGRRFVEVSDLLSKPVPPALDAVLVGNYPPGLRRLGVAGKAAVAARIDADGVVRSVRILYESTEGFGEACRKTVAGSLWSVPRDRTGKPVQTEVQYACDFRVDD